MMILSSSSVGERDCYDICSGYDLCMYKQKGICTVGRSLLILYIRTRQHSTPKINTTMKIVPTLSHEDDPRDDGMLQKEIERWSRSNTTGTLLSQLGFNIQQNPEKIDLLAQQVIRWSWEIQSVQTCSSKPKVTYHPVRTAWLWMEEYGAEIWPQESEKRRHLDPSTGFVYLRDRSAPSKSQAETSLDIEENIAEFCFRKGTLHPYNSMFQNVLRYFASVHAGLWHDVDYTVCRDWTAAELMADFLGSEPWVPLDNLLPLYYEGILSESDGSSGSCDSYYSVCSGSESSAGSKKRPDILDLRPANTEPSGGLEDPMDDIEG
jgi:hypothetical protein